MNEKSIILFPFSNYSFKTENTLLDLRLEAASFTWSTYFGSSLFSASCCATWRTRFARRAMLEACAPIRGGSFIWMASSTLSVSRKIPSSRMHKKLI